jgi:hypothetical protein
LKKASKSFTKLSASFSNFSGASSLSANSFNLPERLSALELSEGLVGGFVEVPDAGGFVDVFVGLFPFHSFTGSSGLFSPFVVIFPPSGVILLLIIF